MARPREPLEPRLMRAIARRGECWIWTGGKTRDGYGVLTVGRRQQRAHRASYETFNGAIPPGMLVCHRCDVPLCINPAHLFLGRPEDNTRDMVAKGRNHRLCGPANPNTKLTPHERETIKDLRRQGLLLKDIASRYGVSFQTVSDICIGRRSYAAGD